MGEVVKRGGFGTSVTPVSQFYFQQAYMNVMMGPWKKISDGYGKMVLGYFGKTPIEPDPEIVKIAAEQLNLEPTTKTPLEIDDANPKKGIEAAKKALTEAGITDFSDENIFIAATCGAKGIAFLQGKAQVGVRKGNGEEKKAEIKKEDMNPSKISNYTVMVNGKNFNVEVYDETADAGKNYSVNVK